MLIEGYSRYTCVDGIITDTDTGKQKKLTTPGRGSPFYKLKDDADNWKNVSSTKVRSLCGDMVIKPEGLSKVPGYSNAWINREGTVYSLNDRYPRGIIHKVTIGSQGYPRVALEGKYRDVHVLLALTFLQADYIAEGLVCMHRDDDKLNYALCNLSIGTYSQNNSDTYARGRR